MTAERCQSQPRVFRHSGKFLEKYQHNIHYVSCFIKTISTVAQNARVHPKSHCFLYAFPVVIPQTTTLHFISLPACRISDTFIATDFTLCQAAETWMCLQYKENNS